MSMSKKDYVAVAAEVKKVLPELVTNGEVRGASVILLAVARVMGRDNPRFDLPKFLAACGVL